MSILRPPGRDNTRETHGVASCPTSQRRCNREFGPLLGDTHAAFLSTI